VGILRNAQSCQGVTCGKSSAECWTNYPLSLFPHSAAEKFTFPRITKITIRSHCATDAQQMRSQCIAASGILWSLPSIFFVVHLPKMVVLLQFLLTSKSLPHSKHHIISLKDVIGFNLYNHQCNSHTDDRTKLNMFNSCDIEQNSCCMSAAVTVAVATDRRYYQSV